MIVYKLFLTATTIQDSMVRSDRLTAEQAAPQENILDKIEVKDPTEKYLDQKLIDLNKSLILLLDSTLAVEKILKVQLQYREVK